MKTLVISFHKFSNSNNYFIEGKLNNEPVFTIHKNGVKFYNYFLLMPNYIEEKFTRALKKLYKYYEQYFNHYVENEIKFKLFTIDDDNIYEYCSTDDIFNFMLIYFKIFPHYPLYVKYLSSTNTKGSHLKFKLSNGKSLTIQLNYKYSAIDNVYFIVSLFYGSNISIVHNKNTFYILPKFQYDRIREWLNVINWPVETGLFFYFIFLLIIVIINMLETVI